MRLVTTCEQRFERLPDGSIWTRDAFSYEHWAPYLQTFDEVCVFARVHEADAHMELRRKRAEGRGVSILPLAHYIGPSAFVLALPPIHRAMRRVVRVDDAILLRGVQLASILRATVLRHGRVYGCEVVGDPYDVFAPGAIRHPLRPLFRRWFTAELKRQCAGAWCALYVTQRYLQIRYPCPGPSFSASDVQLEPDAFTSTSRQFRNHRGPFHLLVVGTLDQMYKGQDLVIGAVAKLVRAGRDVSLTFVGDGRLRPYLESLVAKAGLGERVFFAGALPAGEEVQHAMDRADLLLMPSRTEGLPRALIEAMARAMPAVASRVGGIPELLDVEDLIPPEDVDALAAAIDAAISDAPRLERMSARNLSRSRSFIHEHLLGVRLQFQETLRDLTAGWIAGRGPSR